MTANENDIEVNDHLGLIHYTIEYFNFMPPPRNYTYDDLVSEGALGLCHARDKFNPNKGYKFSTYAVIWIRRYISLFIKRANTMNSSCVYVDDKFLNVLNSYQYIEEDIYSDQLTNKIPELFKGLNKRILTMLSEGKRQTDIANILGLSDNTISVRTKKIKATIKKYLEI